jgi:uncharacterized low-complexity protein
MKKSSILVGVLALTNLTSGATFSFANAAVNNGSAVEANCGNKSDDKAKEATCGDKKATTTSADAKSKEATCGDKKSKKASKKAKKASNTTADKTKDHKCGEGKCGN